MIPGADHHVRSMPRAGLAGSADAAASAWIWLRRALRDAPVPRVLGFVGLGDGSLLDALDRHAPGTRVLAVEPDAAAAAAFRSQPVSRVWQAAGRLVYLVAPNYAGADEAWRLFPIGTIDPPVLIAPGSAVTEAATTVLTKILFGVRANDTARRRFAPRYLVNALRNIPAVTAGSDVRAL